jgi:hypothetical protein
MHWKRIRMVLTDSIVEGNSCRLGRQAPGQKEKQRFLFFSHGRPFILFLVIGTDKPHNRSCCADLFSANFKTSNQLFAAIEEFRMPADWFCEIDGEQYGPVTAGQLRHLATSGKLQPTHPVWKEGMPVSVPARTVKGLFDTVPTPPPAVEAPPPKESTEQKPQQGSSAEETARLLGSALDTKVEEPQALKKEEELIEFELVGPQPKKEEPLVEFEMVQSPAELEMEPPELETEPAELPAEPPKKKKKEEKEEKEEEPELEILAEVPIVYREGYPDLEGSHEGMLIVESTGLRFQFEDEEEFRIPFDKVEDILEPAKGDFPPSMKKKALGKKLGGKAGKLAAGLMGRWLGGDAGKLVEKAGGAAGDMAAKSGELGKPPRNRITVYARIKKERSKIRFDTSGEDSEEMTQEAKVLYKQLQKARNKFTAADGGETNINVVINSSGGEGPAAPARGGRGGASLAPIAPIAGKPFRVMNGGQMSGPYSLEELRGLLGAGKLGSDVLIGVETWLPISTLGGLLGGAPSAAGSTRSGSAATGGDFEEVEEEEESSEDDYGDFEEVDEEEDSEEEEHAPGKLPDDGALPVDDEFKL